MNDKHMQNGQRGQPTFGEKLRHLRILSGKSQAEVANELNMIHPQAKISQTYLSALEVRPGAPREELLAILADYFDVPTAYFLNDSGGTESYKVAAGEAITYLVRALMETEAIPLARELMDRQDTQLSHVLDLLASLEKRIAALEERQPRIRIRKTGGD